MNYLEATKFIHPKNWLYDLNIALRWAFPVIRVFRIVAENSCAIDQWMHLVSLNFFKENTLKTFLSISVRSFYVCAAGVWKKIKQLSATRKCTNFFKK